MESQIRIPRGVAKDYFKAWALQKFNEFNSQQPQFNLFHSAVKC